MTANPLKAAGRNANFTSKIRAAEWARMARQKGLMTHAEAWDQAERDGWDDLHYRPDPQPEMPTRHILSA